MKNTTIVRVPVVRKAIITSGTKFQTIASNNVNYRPYHVMGTYPDIKTARYHYPDDMQELKKSGSHYSHYAIIEVEVHEEEIQC